MSRGISILSRTVTATAALTGFRAVGYDGGLPAAGGPSQGPARFSGAVGDDVTVDVLGESTVEAGAAIAAGEALETDGEARYIPHDAGTVVARALGAATAAGDTFQAVLIVN